MAAPCKVRVTPYRDGPLIVRGAARIVDAGGRELTPRRDPIALCRCGKSRLRPFCDGTHKLIGFRAPGVPDSGDDGWLGDLARIGIEIP
ncbi:MAG: CDGSH iron-sulfur domain-containing protein [Actinobacteria bacterium]|jgi:CDGSH-type Zn-finger protein|nr:MAG: CDGSH iron-sulfur domain-containing protein [Actinomycetota bacterium]